MARFQHEQALRDELASTKTERHAQSIELQEQNHALQARSNELQALEAELQNRKIIERAKGLRMQRQNLREQQAYDRLHKTALGNSLKLVDVAQRMPDVEDLIG